MFFFYNAFFKRKTKQSLCIRGNREPMSLGNRASALGEEKAFVCGEEEKACVFRKRDNPVFREQRASVFGEGKVCVCGRSRELVSLGSRVEGFEGWKGLKGGGV